MFWNLVIKKNNQIKKSTYLFIAIILVVNIRCTELGNCKNAISPLADLITKAIGLASGTTQVSVGSVVDIAISIQNLLDATNECGLTDAAGISKYDLTFLYRPNGKSDWDTIGTAKYSADEILAGYTFDDAVGFEFKVPGEYDIVGYSDVDNDVEERVENNNDKNAGSLNGTKSTRYIIVTDNSKSEITKHDIAKPYVIPVKEDNLIEFKFKETLYY